MDDAEVTLKIWLMGGGEPLVIGLTKAGAAEHLDTIIKRLAVENPVGSITFSNGTMVRFAAIAAARIVDPVAPWAMRE